jgi:chemotaxis response regulator CheB
VDSIMRIGIVNDLAIATEVLRRVVVSDPQHQVAWTAKDGDEAVRRCQEDTPDAVLMDLVMPGMSGAAATREIMRRSPCAVLVVTATVAGNFSLVCEAMSYGAYDAVPTPSIGSESPDKGGAEILAKLSRVDQINRQIRSGSWATPATVAEPRPPAFEPRPVQASSVSPSRAVPIVAIGASTGGPAALEAILTKWPTDFPGAVLITQHVGTEFAAPLAEWLAGRCKIKVRTAQSGDTPQVGSAMLAATSDHMVFTRNGTLRYARDPESCPYRPSVDALFQSLADFRGRPGIAILLTGIGSDGAAGLRKLRDAGWLTIAQNQATSVVYGMPQAAAKLEAATRILPLGDIAAFVEDSVRRIAK